MPREMKETIHLIFTQEQMLFHCLLNHEFFHQPFRVHLFVH